MGSTIEDRLRHAEETAIDIHRVNLDLGNKIAQASMAALVFMADYGRPVSAPSGTTQSVSPIGCKSLLPGETITASQSGTTHSAVADGSGKATFTLPAGTWLIAWPAGHMSNPITVTSSSGTFSPGLKPDSGYGCNCTNTPVNSPTTFTLTEIGGSTYILTLTGNEWISSYNGYRYSNGNLSQFGRAFNRTGGSCSPMSYNFVDSTGSGYNVQLRP